MSLNLEFCSESKTSSRAEKTSPLWSLLALSTSSNSITGFFTPAFFRAEAIRPGIAPTYVFLCPRISASSRTPPRLIRTYFLSSALATERAIELLPVPGGPTRHKIGLSPLPVSKRTDKYSRIRSFTFSSP